MKRIVYHVEARFDVLEIVEYFEREGGVEVADRFTTELELFIEMVAERPLGYREFKHGIRRANLHRFPHHILNQILDADTIRIISVKHDRRRPSYGFRRR
jgi:plasmid stabilization system protein ParE